MVSCNDSKKENDTISNQNQSVEAKDELGTSAQDQPIDQFDPDARSENVASEKNKKETTTTTSGSISGTYLNTEHQEDTSCKCYCIEVTTAGSSELCLKDRMYINARFKQNGSNIEIYYTGKSSGTDEKDIPWDKFETGTPIAVLSPEPNGILKLNWKGFSIDGEIAIDYALLGKKTLEGTYKKK